MDDHKPQPELGTVDSDRRTLLYAQLVRRKGYLRDEMDARFKRGMKFDKEQDDLHAILMLEQDAHGALELLSECSSWLESMAEELDPIDEHEARVLVEKIQQHQRRTR